MELKEHYYHSQLEAIQDFYKTLRSKETKNISLTDAIITWFTDGHAEQFREAFLKNNSFISPN